MSIYYMTVLCERYMFSREIISHSKTYNIVQIAMFECIMRHAVDPKFSYGECIYDRLGR